MQDNPHCTQNHKRRKRFDLHSFCSTTRYREATYIGDHMKFVPLNRGWKFTLFDYTQTDTHILGYQCAYCKWIYTQGRYGLEAGNLIVCHAHLVRCTSCDALIPRPLLWLTQQGYDRFLVETHTKGADLKFSPMTSSWPVRVLCPAHP